MVQSGTISPSAPSDQNKSILHSTRAMKYQIKQIITKNTLKSKNETTANNSDYFNAAVLNALSACK